MVEGGKRMKGEAQEEALRSISDDAPIILLEAGAEVKSVADTGGN